MNRRALPLSFYRRDTATVARELLGARLCRRLPDGALLAGRIVETEAYLGTTDPACHTFGGRHTPRTATMYAAGGVAYVYLIYGMHWCLNAVTRQEGEPEAVLIRAVAAEAGQENFAAALPHLKPAQWLSGPGRLCRAMAIGRAQNGVSLRSDELWIEKGVAVGDEHVAAVPRVGVDYAGEAAQWPLRFYVKGEPAVSRK